MQKFFNQNLDNQINQLKSASCEKIFSEKKSGKNETDRREFNIMMDFIIEGDVLYIIKLDKLARSYRFTKYCKVFGR